MNLSGDSLICILENRPPNEMIVIVDDVCLPIGRIRLRPKGSDGGHNGLKSIIRHCGTSFWRLRIGVGLPEMSNQEDHKNLVDHVLGPLSDLERLVISRIFCCLPEIVVQILIGNGARAMSKYNGKKFIEPEPTLLKTTIPIEQYNRD